MFDYQAGEKFKLTLIMVAFAGVMGGMLFTLLLMPQDSPKQRKHHKVNWSTSAQEGNSGRSSRRSGQSQQAPESPVVQISAADASSLVQSWLPLAWDLSAGTASKSQEQAIQYMTPDCAAAYKQNVWTPDVARTIDDAKLQSSFTPTKITPGTPQADGSIVIFVEGTQVMSVPGKGTQQKEKKLEYLVKSTPEGVLRVAGISESGQQN